MYHFELLDPNASFVLILIWLLIIIIFFLGLFLFQNSHSYRTQMRLFFSPNTQLFCLIFIFIYLVETPLQNTPSYRIQMRLFLQYSIFCYITATGHVFFCLFFSQGSAASQLFHHFFFLLIFIFIYLAEIPLQGPRYQLGANNFLFLFQHIPSYFFIVFNFLLLNSYRSCFWSNFFPKVQTPVSYFIKLKVCTDL